MAPKKQPPPAASGARPRRVTRATAKLTSPEPSPSSATTKSPKHVVPKTTPQPAPNVNVSPSPSLSAPIFTETTPVTFSAETAANNGGEEKETQRINCAGNETLDNNINASPEISGGIEEKESTTPKKKKTVKKVIVTVVKKVVKKRVPKSMIKELAAAAASGSSSSPIKELNNKEEDVSDDNNDDDEDDKLNSEGMEEDKGLPLSVEEVVNMEVDDLITMGEEGNGVVDALKNELVVQNSDFATAMPVETVNSELVRGAHMDNAVQEADFSVEMPEEVANSELLRIRENENIAEKSDSPAEVLMEAVNADLVRDIGNSNDDIVQKSDFTTAMPMETLNSELVGGAHMDNAVREADFLVEMPGEVVSSELLRNRENENIAEKSDSLAEVLMEEVNADLVKDRGSNNDGIVQESDFVTAVSVEVVNTELVGDSSNEAEVHVTNSTTELSMEVANAELVENKNNCDIGQNSDSCTEIPIGMINVDLVGDTKDDGVALENDSSTEMAIEAINADLVGDRHDTGVAQAVGSSTGYGEDGKGYGDAGKGKIPLSGELEALERRRRRRTEIFIGGLHTDAKEEDVRNVFEEVGEIVELRVVFNSKTGKNKGYAFVKYASAVDAKKALEKYAKVEICGKQCSTAPVEGNDTIFLGNIDKKWATTDVTELLQEIGIEKIDKVTVMANPSNVARNRGFAFVEFETYKDAQNAYKKLQKKDLGKLQNIKVAWAEPISEPDEEELLKVKSVYAEYLPPSWDEEKVKTYFTKFGEIDNIVLSRNLHSSKRKDFAFINFETREAALTCIETFNHETLVDEGSQVNVKVSLAKPIPKGKLHKKISEPPTKEISKQKRATHYPAKPTEPRKKESPVIRINSQRNNDSRSPGTSQLEQLLAERALQKQMQGRLGTGTTNLEYFPVSRGQKRYFSALGDDLSYSDPRRQTHMRVENPFPVGRSLSRGEVPQGAGTLPYSYYQQQGPDYEAGHRYMDYAHSFQREEPRYHGRGRGYYRCKSTVSSLFLLS
ncbi:nucleolin 2-like isoform X1 [Mercurialis annua]|uniref:nucleolin 2-like isoform X1 n=2 Tax=Mercurialis annua TaxID=3986 RepID=UPI0024AF7A22|nr:nucleolin 2-like isoform X1 [Mercurialis annua]